MLFSNVIEMLTNVIFSFGTKIKSSSFYYFNNFLDEIKSKDDKIDPFVRLLPAIMYTENEVKNVFFFQ